MLGAATPDEHPHLVTTGFSCAVAGSACGQIDAWAEKNNVENRSTSFNETPARASRPFDRDRDGFVMGEGAGILVVEELEYAIRRGAKPLAEIIGYGTTADAYHITSGPEDGDGARRAMQGALRQACLKPEGKIAVSATKSATGHLLGAAGGAEAIFTIALRDQVAPPTLNLDHADTTAEGVDIVAREARRMSMEFLASRADAITDQGWFERADRRRS
jgi:3-oxoacyl-[acyl-carrier-protein] synthase II